jgi:hypothetical protein
MTDYVDVLRTVGSRSNAAQLGRMPSGTQVVTLQHMLRHDLAATIFAAGTTNPLLSHTVGTIVLEAFNATRRRRSPYNQRSGLPFNRLLSIHINQVEIDRTHEDSSHPPKVRLLAGHSLVFAQSVNDIRPVERLIGQSAKGSIRGIGSLLLRQEDEASVVEALFHPATEHQLEYHPVEFGVPSIAAVHGARPAYWHALRSNMPHDDRFVETVVAHERIMDELHWSA